MQLNAPPPPGAVVLFDGSGLAGWESRYGGPADWHVADGVLTIKPGARDIMTTRRFLDHQLHIELKLVPMPDKTGQEKSNSGIYLQGLYEIQVLDSSGWARPGTGDGGALFGLHAPLTNACLPRGEWQHFDVVFRSARLGGDGAIAEPARATVLLNGTVIHNNVILPNQTLASLGPDQAREGEPGPLLLQDHGDPVSFRNIWVVELPLQGSDQYEPA